MEHRNTFQKVDEISDTMIRKGIKIACLQETKWVEERSREIENTGCILWFTGKEKHRNR